MATFAAYPATRPRYGGVLRAEMRASLGALDPAEPGEAASRLAPLVFDRLVRIDRYGRPQPAIAVSWTHDAAARRWQFRLRSGVKFHDGAVLSAGPALAAALQSTLRDLSVTPAAGGLTIECPYPAPNLLLELGERSYVFARTADGAAVGTGPFRLIRLEPHRHVSLAANEEYWGGRPFLDGVEVEMGRGAREQWVDLEVGKADLVELAPGNVRRARAGDRNVVSSAPSTLVALLFREGRPADARVREALALSVDRPAIHNVLLQRRGDVAGALLPQWLSGYAFLFPAAQDLNRARALANEAAPGTRSLALGYDPADALARAIAERVAVNARDAGLTVQAVPQSARSDATVAAVRLASLDPAQALGALAAALGVADWRRPDSPEALYAAERALLEGGRAVPLFHLPQDFAVGPRVKTWFAPPVSQLGAWQLEDLWLEGTR